MEGVLNDREEIAAREVHANLGIEAPILCPTEVWVRTLRGLLKGYVPQPSTATIQKPEQSQQRRNR